MEIGVDNSLTVLKEFREFIIPLGEEELFQLEKSILTEGCREPLVVWERGRQLVVIDGHNRYSICRKNNIPFGIRKTTFNDIDEAKIWMINNQMGRRNLTPDQLSYYRGIKYLALKKKKGGQENVKSKGQKEISTSEYIAKQFNVSESTVKRDARFAEGLNIINKSNPKLKMKILTGEVKIKKGDVQILPSGQNSEKLTIKNEADLFYKANLIKNEVLNQVEKNIRKLDGDKILMAQEVVLSVDPVFLKKEDKLKKIKGMILSAINKAINERDGNAIGELKKLIDRLEDIIFD